jgi:hypothetical protein
MVSFVESWLITNALPLGDKCAELACNYEGACRNYDACVYGDENTAR